MLLSYELASVANRLSSNIIDLAIVYILNLLRIIVFSSGFPATYFVENIALIWLYHLVIVVFFRGLTPGMRIVHIRIQKPDGSPVVFSELFLRWIMRPLDITLSVCALGLFMMMGSEKRQRLGDVYAGTVVVKEKPQLHFSFTDILRMHTSKPMEQVQYPMARHLKEEDMLLVKNLIQNSSGHSSDVHYAAIVDCAFTIGTLLGVENRSSNHREFLQQVVNDYIQLTR